MPTGLLLSRFLLAAAVVPIVLTLSHGPSYVSAATLNVDGTDPACDDLAGAPYCTVGAAVADAMPGDTIHVFPGAYAESLNLDSMAVQGDVGFVTVDPAGTPTPGTAMVDPAAAGGTGTGAAFFTVASPFPGSIAIDGFLVTSPDTYGIDVKTGSGDISLADVSIVGSGDGLGDDDGARLRSSSGAISVTDSSADGNADDGFQISTGGSVTLTGSTSSGNGGAGFLIDGDDVTVTDTGAEANGKAGFDVTSAGDTFVADSTATENAGQGFHLASDAGLTVSASTSSANGSHGFDVEPQGDLTVDRVTAAENAADGMRVGVSSGEVGGVTITNSILQANNGIGIVLENDIDVGRVHRVQANLICENGSGGLRLDAPTAPLVEAAANWWGGASGPFHPVSNPAGTGDEVFDGANGGAGTVDFAPWIDAVNASADPATEGLASAVRFQFSGAAGTVFLDQGPGDPNGPPPFSLLTDNGTVTPSAAFISRPDGTIEAMLTPEKAGEATVSVAGPCGLGNLHGSTIVLDVLAAPSDAPDVAPAPAEAPAGLPEAGGQPGHSGTRNQTLALMLVLGPVLSAAGAAFVLARR